MSTKRSAPTALPLQVICSAGSVMASIGRATNGARLALEAVTIDPDSDRCVSHLAELVLLALRARRWEEEGFVLPAPLAHVAHTYI